jgi:dTDP-4-amino-4,6-dideoxygalactose transaminase
VDSGWIFASSGDGLETGGRDSRAVAHCISFDRANDPLRREPGLHRYRSNLLPRRRSSEGVVVGYNCRFNEIQAAIGRVELRNTDKLNEHRRRVAARYTERLSGGVKTPMEKEWAYAVYHMYVIRTERRDELAKHLQSKGISTGIHYPVANHQQPAITKLYSDLPKLPWTEAIVKEILSLPIYGELPLDDVDYVCDAILEFFDKE